MMEEVLLSEDINKILEYVDYNRLGQNVAIKVHFGEGKCDTFTDPLIVKKVYEKIISMGKNASLVECNVLYKGSRTMREDHLAIAKKHGFDFAPIDILDGEKGEEFIEVKSDNLTAKLGKGLEKYDSMIVISHFKGHMMAGFGGALKNVGMGLGSRAGKLHMHCSIKPSISINKCIGCGICVQNCDVKAITITDMKAKIDNDKCVGCAMCIAVCPQKAVSIPWGSMSSDELQKRFVEYAKAVMNLIEKDKMIFINVLQNITTDCDCMDKKQIPIMKDVGILLSNDIVSIDKASFDLANEHSNFKFNSINKINKNIQLDYASDLGIGTKSYICRKV